MKASIKIPHTVTESTLTFDQIKCVEGIYAPVGGNGDPVRIVVVGFREGSGADDDDLKETVVIFVGDDGGEQNIEPADQSYWVDMTFVRTNEKLTISIE